MHDEWSQRSTFGSRLPVWHDSAGGAPTAVDEPPSAEPLTCIPRPAFPPPTSSLRHIRSKAAGVRVGTTQASYDMRARGLSAWSGETRPVCVCGGDRRIPDAKHRHGERPNRKKNIFDTHTRGRWTHWYSMRENNFSTRPGHPSGGPLRGPESLSRWSTTGNTGDNGRRNGRQQRETGETH